MPCFYLTPEQDDFNQIPELQVCLTEALYDAEAVLSNPRAFRAWKITGRSEDELTGASASVSSSPSLAR